MQEMATELEQALTLALKLSPQDKAHLIEKVARTLEQDLEPEQSEPRESLLGILAQYGSAPSAEEIDEVQREIWSNFPREDI